MFGKRERQSRSDARRTSDSTSASGSCRTCVVFACFGTAWPTRSVRVTVGREETGREGDGGQKKKYSNVHHHPIELDPVRLDKITKAYSSNIVHDNHLALGHANGACRLTVALDDQIAPHIRLSHLPRQFSELFDDAVHHIRVVGQLLHEEVPYVELEGRSDLGSPLLPARSDQSINRSINDGHLTCNTKPKRRECVIGVFTLSSFSAGRKKNERRRR